MRAFEIAIIMRTILALCFLGVGLAALIIGWRLYATGVGREADGVDIGRTGGGFGVTASLKTVGSVVMATSILWGVLAFYSLPNLVVTEPGQGGGIQAGGSGTGSSTNASTGTTSTRSNNSGFSGSLFSTNSDAPYLNNH
jgi:hypothetical protein